MSTFLPYLITGLVAGSLYGLAGVGLVLTFRTSGVFNFGHGAIAAAAAYIFYTLHVTHGVAWPLATLITMVLFGLVAGLVLERITRTLDQAPQAMVVVATVGIFLFVQGLLNVQYGSSTRNFPEFLPQSGFTIAEVQVSWAQVISGTVALGGAVLLFVFLRASRLGAAMRAVVDNPSLISLTGQRPVRIRRAAWVIGSSVAALSGILLAPVLGLDATLLALLVVQAFGACAVGRFASLPMTYVGGLVVGVAAAVSTRYITERPFSGIPSTVPFLVLILVLVVQPTSRFPQRRVSVRSITTQPSRMPVRRSAPLAGVTLLVLLLVPHVVGTKLPVWINFLTYVVLFTSLALLVWTSGQISLCHSAFAAIGATTLGHLTTGSGVPWGVALLAAGLAAVPAGALVALPAIRLSGIYLALATLGFGVLMQNVVYQAYFMFGDKTVVEANRPDLGPIHGANDQDLYYVVLGIAALCVGLTVLISRSRLGMLLRAMSESPTMLATHGLDVNVTRLVVFCTSAFLAGIAGGLIVTQAGGASGVAFGPINSLFLLAVLGMCGTRLLRSPVIAALLFAVVPAYVTSFDTPKQTLLFGAAAVIAGMVAGSRTEIEQWVRRQAERTDARRDAGPIADRQRQPLVRIVEASG